MSTLQNKLNNYEVVPPAAAWDNIAAALDEGVQGAQFPSKLNNMEVAPPVAAWGNIAAALDENAQDVQFPSKLYNMEVIPPAAAWTIISDSIQQQDPKVVSINKRRSSFYKYTVAAVLISIIALAGMKWIGNFNSGTAGIATTNPPVKSTSSEKKITPSDQSATVEGTATIPSTEKDPVLLAEVESPVKSHLRKSALQTASAIDYSYDETAARDVSANPIYAYEDHIPNIADRYIMLMTPDGKFIRMSKKWGNLICCVSGEEQDADCKDQLKKWQEKIASSTLAPSPGNFLDILSLVSSLEDN
ncbi:MAG: hypothetical protein ABI480_14150 [Chitinophagaceae bacterium]